MKDINEAMRNLKENEKELLWEMANPHPNDTGLPSMLQSLYDGKHRVSHAARVKVDTPNFGLVPIQIDPEVKLPKSMQHKNFQNQDLKNIDAAIEYIKMNRDLFMKHWNGEITDKELLNSLPHI